VDIPNILELDIPQKASRDMQFHLLAPILPLEDEVIGHQNVPMILLTLVEQMQQ
jgi:hypothetical protein